MKKKVGIIGASGFTGRELAGLLAKDEHAEIVFLSSRSYAGKISRETGTAYEALEISDFIAREPDCVFLCTPHGIAMETAPLLLAQNIRVVDLSADFRLKDAEIFQRTYGIPYKHPGTEPVYGLTEWFGAELEQANLVANPGCYVTGALMSLLPVMEYSEWAVFDGKSGYSGAGAEKADALRIKLKENSCAYALASHRHAPEIQQFSIAPIHFTPHLLPFFRGMEVTAHLKIRKGYLANDLFELYAKTYANNRYVRVQKEIPEIREVQNTNLIVLGGFETDENGRLVISAVLDNLRKGAASQAVQNFHVMFGLPEIIPDAEEIVKHELVTPLGLSSAAACDG